ncbi:MAG: FHA domain-containing protein [Deltaproteobacteria bacterium]|nr:FHA domain-containing protein [Deltaproteobacteria bacterium]
MLHLSAEIQILQDGVPVHGVALSSGALFVGRAPDNDLVLSLPQVSLHHAVFRRVESTLMVRDLGSTNGTFLNDERLLNLAPLKDGDTVRLGASVFLRIRLSPSEIPAPPPAPLSLLVDLSAGVAWPLRSDRVVLGPDPGSDVHIPHPGFPVAHIALHPDGEAWVATEDFEFPAVEGEPFLLGDRAFVLRAGKEALDTTARERVPPERPGWPYRLTVWCGAEGRTEARLQDLHSQQSHLINADNRVAFLYLLARRRLRDRAWGAGVGWCDDNDLQKGIWGRAWEEQDPNNLQVLLSRIRREIREAGFDAWFIEKRRGQTRILLDELDVHPE